MSFINVSGKTIAPYDETDPRDILCPNPKCEGGEVFTQKAFGIRREKGLKHYCQVCDGSVTISSDDGTNRMWDAVEWADRRRLDIEVEVWL